MMAYRSADHETTGYTPNEMMMGREATLPVDLLMERPKDDQQENQVEYVARRQECMEQVHQYAREHLQIASDRHKRNYDHKADHGGYSKGDIVWLYNPKRKRGHCPKFQLPWDGPYVVTTCMSDVTYRIQKGAKGKPRIVHYNRLKPYTGENAPTWYQDTARARTPATVDGDENGTERRQDTRDNRHQDKETLEMTEKTDESESLSQDRETSETTAKTNKEKPCQQRNQLDNLEKDEGLEQDNCEARRSHRERRPPARYGDR